HAMHAIARLAGRPDNFLMTLVTDKENVVALTVKTSSLCMHLGHERTRRVDRAKLTRLGFLVNRRRDTVRRENDDPALRDLFGLLDEHCAERLETSNHMRVVHDLLADVDRRAVPLERSLNRLYGAIDTGAIATRAREQHAPTRLRTGLGHSSMLRPAVT